MLIDRETEYLKGPNCFDHKHCHDDVIWCWSPVGQDYENIYQTFTSMSMDTIQNEKVNVQLHKCFSPADKCKISSSSAS